MKTRLSFLKTMVLHAAEAINKTMPSSGIVNKPGRENFLTAADLASEKLIIASIKKAYPEEDILSEETKSRFSNEQLLSSPHLWVIDPIDGTNNFKNERGFSAISIGYVQNGQIQTGVVYNFTRGEMFWAMSAHGAYLNNQPIKTGSQSDITKGTVAAETYYTDEVTRGNLNILLTIKPIPFILIRGCASLAICEVAAGRTDLYFHTALMPWDNAAAFLIAKESGAVVKGLKNEEVNFLSPHAVIGNEQVVTQFTNFIRKHP